MIKLWENDKKLLKEAVMDAYRTAATYIKNDFESINKTKTYLRSLLKQKLTDEQKDIIIDLLDSLTEQYENNVELLRTIHKYGTERN
jgi:hypothetical protein